LTSSTPPGETAAPTEPAPDVSPWDLAPDLYERWEERVCIMHFDGQLPWREAEVLALADVLRQSGPVAGPEARLGTTEDPAAAEGRLFPAIEGGPYGCGL
jgi:hypothetical protein